MLPVAQLHPRPPGGHFPVSWRRRGRSRRRRGRRPDWPDFLIDLATLEWTFAEVFDGPGVEGQPLLRPRRCKRSPPERFAEARLVPVPCLRLLTFRYPVNAYFTAARQAEGGGGVPHPDPAPEYTALTRRDFIVRRYPATPPQYALLAPSPVPRAEKPSPPRGARRLDDEALAAEFQLVPNVGGGRLFSGDRVIFRFLRPLFASGPVFSFPRGWFASPARFLASRASIFLPARASWLPGHASSYPQRHLSSRGAILASRAVIFVSRGVIFLPGAAIFLPEAESWCPGASGFFPSRNSASGARNLGHHLAPAQREGLAPGVETAAGVCCRRGGAAAECDRRSLLQRSPGGCRNKGRSSGIGTRTGSEQT